MKEGFSFGVGSSIANVLVRSLFSSVPQNSGNQGKQGKPINREYDQCLRESNDPEACKHLNTAA